jgi:hypothetical protein
MAIPDRPIDATLAVAADVHHVVSLPRGWETIVVLLGVQLAQVLTVVLATACVLLGLLALVAHFRHRVPPQVLQPVYARPIVRRATGRPCSADLTPLPSRDPPPVPPFWQQLPDPDRETR